MADSNNGMSAGQDREALHRERERAASIIARQRRELDHLLAERRRLRQEVDHLERKLEQVRSSTTWRVGDAIMSLPKRLKDTFRDRRRAGASVSDSLRQLKPTVVPPHLQLDVEPHEETAARTRYEDALKRRRFDGEGPGIAFLVSTIDLSQGRGDLYVAIGLGMALERLGYQTMYLPPKDWYDLPGGTGLVVSLLAESSVSLDPLRLPSTVRTVAWVRNNTDRWTSLPWLNAYDAVLCSSRSTEQRIRRAYRGPTGVCRIGVDPDLFSAATGDDAREGVVTTVNQWGGTRATYAALQSADIDFPLAIFGVQRGLGGALQGFARGPVSYFSLPSVYRRAVLVLDDQQESNAVFGNVNSRIYEALAAGALPVTNTRLGLTEVGLEQLPVAEGPDELGPLVRSLVDDDERRDALVSTLRAVVLERHTYEQRATSFAAFIEEHDLLRGNDRQRAPVIGFSPDYTVTNPFQDMLYSALHERGAVTIPVRDPFDLATMPAVADRAVVFHLHWTAPILGGSLDEPDARGRVRSFLDGLDLVRDHGGRIVWTVHNVMPHECAYPDVEAELRQGIADRADRVHVMCARTSAATRPAYVLPHDRTAVIPHGSYLDVYPDIVSEDVARAELGIPADATVLLFLGQIRPYKGIDRLLRTFDEARRRDPSLRLLVAGAPGKFEGVRAMLDRIRAQPGVTAVFEEIPDDDLQVYLRAADVMVLPHEKVLNSGAALLALTFGRPIIAPDTGCLSELVTDDVGFTFRDRAELVEAMTRATELRGVRYRRAAYHKAQQHTARDMAASFADLLASDLGMELRGPSGGGGSDE